jgi:hypothetical protein
MRRDVRGGLWLRAVVFIEDDVDADTPLMGIDPHLGDGAAGQRSARTRLLQGASPRGVTRGRPLVLYGWEPTVTLGPRSGAPPG